MSMFFNVVAYVNYAKHHKFPEKKDACPQWQLQYDPA